ncbi:hypothetical protein [Leptospira adleri]|uniref:hypothetical protein n=1 Tax=Leptospira adleri TaxID=2023186 RepID=UPI00108398F3|nr:hypothetical protein [Leptospira adleri]TGM52881.1 hypothetical protein EHQ97_13260 [Leptospira adleri]
MSSENISNWEFKITEVSNGVYQVKAIDQQGRKIELEGIEPETLLTNCKKYASEINKQTKS